ncbi:uncharacterized protein LOC143519752 [Brachyhypopomus gauderio]|uniref:uncharacterized protein LOC143519752 n=1 Tax=Brachyhypopomus gauderio TaxID=698409 RepID=UPI0040424A0C
MGSQSQHHLAKAVFKLNKVLVSLFGFWYSSLDNLKPGTPRKDPYEQQILRSFSKPDLAPGPLQKVDQEVEATAKVLLHKAAESNAFTRQDVDTALDSMVQNCTPIWSMNALLAGGLCHLNAAVRKCTARHLATLAEKIGAERIIPAVSKLAQDSSQETRRLGRRMLLFLSSHHDFDKMVEKYIPAKDLATIRDTVLTLKSEERTKVSRIPRYKMRQPRLEQQEAPAAQAERHNTLRMKRSLRHTVRDVSPDDAAPLKDLQLNSNVPAQTKTGVLLDDLPSSPSNARTPRSPVKSLSPPLRPSPPTAVPTTNMLPRRRRAIRLIRARPSLSNCSNELKPGAPRKDRPFSNPDLALTQSFSLLSTDDWEKKIEGLISIRRLAQHHSHVLGSRRHDVCIILIQEVRNLRSAVSRMAVVSLRELYSSLQKGMDQEVEATSKVLLHKAAESNGFIRQDVDTALDSMVQNCTPIRSMNPLLSGGLCHLNAAVRNCTARHLATVVEKIGAGRLLSGVKDVTTRIIPAVSKLAQDFSQETRVWVRCLRILLQLEAGAPSQLWSHAYLLISLPAAKTAAEHTSTALQTRQSTSSSSRPAGFKRLQGAH